MHFGEKQKCNRSEYSEPSQTKLQCLKEIRTIETNVDREGVEIEETEETVGIDLGI